MSKMGLTYNTITNDTRSRSTTLHANCMLENIFSDEELNEILKLMTSVPLDAAGTYAGKKASNPAASDTRRVSRVNFFSPSVESQWIFQRFNKAIESINNTFYNFDLNGYNVFQYTEYHAEESGKYDFHNDMILRGSFPPEMHENRKLSFTFLLNEPGIDFEGGELEFFLGTTKEPDIVVTKKGRLVAFPSFIVHRVKPVTKGVRKSIVFWVTGPKFI